MDLQAFKRYVDVKRSAERRLMRLPGALGVDVGHKYVAGLPKSEVAIRVFVRRKRGDVPDAERVPKDIDGIPTDVIETEPFRVFAVADTTRYDPLKGGCSIGSCEQTAFAVQIPGGGGPGGGSGFPCRYGDGTMGLVVTDRANGKPAILSNFHVLVPNGDANKSKGQTLLQPGAAITGCVCDQRNLAGYVTRGFLGEETDAAIADISGRQFSGGILDINELAPAREMRALQTTIPEKVQKRGAITRLTHGIIDGVDHTATVDVAGQPHDFSHQLTIRVDPEFPDASFATGGDSGALIVAEDASVVGLLVGGNAIYTFANPIGSVIRDLNIDLRIGPRRAHVRTANPAGFAQDVIYTTFDGLGKIFLSPDGDNPGGGGSSEPVYRAGQTLVAMTSFQGHVISAFSAKGIYSSPDGRNLGGGGNTPAPVYNGTQGVIAMTGFAGGVLTAFELGGIYLSPDGDNLGGGGATGAPVFQGARVVAMVPFQNGVIIAFDDKAIFFSPDGRNPHGGGNTIQVYNGTQRLVAMTAFSGGVLTAFELGGLYLSPDGDNLGGGGATGAPVFQGARVVAMVPFQNGVIIAFDDKAVFRSPDGKNPHGGGNSVRVYDGTQAVVSMAAFHGGVVTTFDLGGIYLSPDGDAVGGGGNTQLVYGLPG